MRLPVGLWCVFVLACTPSPSAPPRPLAVPSTAAWAGGADGGAWVDCWRVADVLRQHDGAAHPELDDRFDCTIHSERGTIDAKGRYRLLDVEDGLALRPAREPRRVLRFTGWDGCRLHADPNRVLVHDAKVQCAGGLCTDGGC